jgi:hypothetical protein
LSDIFFLHANLFRWIVKLSGHGYIELAVEGKLGNRRITICWINLHESFQRLWELTCLSLKWDEVSFSRDGTSAGGDGSVS